MLPIFYAAAIQMAAGPKVARNLDRADRLVRTAAGHGAKLIVLPEVFHWRGEKSDERAVAETIPGPTSRQLADLAKELGIYLQAGSIRETAEDGQRAFNTALLFGPSGDELARYRKIHLFDVALPDRVAVRESESFAPGSEVVCAETEVGTIGLSICYDLRFPELYRELAARGVEVLTVPAAFTRPTGIAHWEVLVRARAIENQCYVIAANQHGQTPYGHFDHGHSMIVDPWGRILGTARDGDGIVLAELRSETLASVRAQLPSLQHRRL